MGLVVKNLLVNEGDTRDASDPWVGKVPWRRKCQLTPVFVPGKFHRLRSLMATVCGFGKSQTWLSD